MSNELTTWAAGLIGSRLYALRYGGRTVRCFVKAAADCSGMYIRLNNFYGRRSAEIAKMTIIEGEKAIPVLFDGNISVVLKKGERIRSDLVRTERKEGDLIEIRMLVKSALSDCSTGLLPAEHSPAGDYTEGAFTADDTRCWVKSKLVYDIPHQMPYINSVDILTESEKKAVAVFGSSNEFVGHWVTPFAERVEKELGRNVLNLGVSGNRLLRNTGKPYLMGQLFGNSGLQRVQWDLLELSNIGTVVLKLCGNDITQPGTYAAPASQLPTMDEVMDGVKAFAEKLHERGIRTVLLTMTPCAGSDGVDERKLSMIREYNDWIRSGAVCDAFFDFNAVCRDPDNPDRYLPSYDSGDHLHLNAECGKAVADAFDLSLL